MSGQKNIHPLPHPGTVQTGRMPSSLFPDQNLLDNRGAEDLFKYLFAIAKEAGYFDHNQILKDGSGNFLPNDNWQALLKELTTEQLETYAASGSVPPHLALLELLTQLFQHPQRLLNANIKRHLDYYYKDVLHLLPAAPQPDLLHAIFEIKKNQAPTLLKAGTLLNGAKDAKGNALNYGLTHDIIVSPAAVQQIQGFFIDEKNTNNLHYAPVANSSDGLGAKLPKEDARWDAFGDGDWPLASVGFALASPVLKMAEGGRIINIMLEITGLAAGMTNADFDNSFAAALTGPKGWINKGSISTIVAGGSTNAGTNIFTFTITLSDKDPAVVDYDADIHSSRFVHTLPIVQLILNNRKTEPGYQFWKVAKVINATIDVTVKQVTALQIATDTGVADAKKPFFPFGPTAEKLASCNINYPEAFDKILKNLTLTVSWKNIPTANLGTYFSAYGISNNNQFTAYTSFEDGGKWKFAQSQPLFENNAMLDRVFSFVNPDYSPPLLQFLPWFESVKPRLSLSPGEPLMQKVFGIQKHSPAPFVFQKTDLLQNIKAIRMVMMLYTPDAPKKQGINLQLNRGFFFREYRAKLASTVANFSKDGTSPISLPNEPFAPEIKTLSLDYSATSGKVILEGGLRTITSITDPVHYYHVSPFGVRHEHPATRLHLVFLQNTGVSFLPQYNRSGECYLGISGVKALDELTLLLQVSEGSANPEKKRTPVSWHVLANNYWRKLGNRDLIFDTSEGLITSGVIRLVLPGDTTTVNTWMTDGLVWLRMSVFQDNDAVCRMVDIKTNAAIAILQGSGIDMSHFGQTLPAGSTGKMVTPAPGIKSVSQPYAGFGGRPAETDPPFYTRVSERLRHKQRAITGFDIERLILQEFPSVYMVNCVQHSNAQTTEAAGETLVVLVPDVSNNNAPQPFEPKADIYTLERVKAFLENISTSWVSYTMSNPLYQPVKVTASIKLNTGFAFGYYGSEIEKALQQYLAPWIGGNAGRFRFGGRVTNAQVVNFLENLPYVDYVSNLQLYHAADGKTFGSPVKDVVILHPAGVLTSAETHTLTAL